jgi:hypothetical protein
MEFTNPKSKHIAKAARPIPPQREANATTKALSKSLLCRSEMKNKKISSASQKLNLLTHEPTNNIGHKINVKRLFKTLTDKTFGTNERRTTTHNISYPQVAVKWLYRVHFFNQTLVRAEGFSLQNHHLQVSENR